MALVKAGVVVLDCAEPEKLAVFYKELLDAEETDATANRVEIRGADGFRLAFRRDVNATPPSWPRPENSLQAHLDFVVEDLDEVGAQGGRSSAAARWRRRTSPGRSRSAATPTRPATPSPCASRRGPEAGLRAAEQAAG